LGRRIRLIVDSTKLSTGNIWISIDSHSVIMKSTSIKFITLFIVAAASAEQHAFIKRASTGTKTFLGKETAVSDCAMQMEAPIMMIAGPDYHLAPGGSPKCDYGVPLDAGKCQAAVTDLATKVGKTPGRPLQKGAGGGCMDGAWGQVPAGCSAQSGGDWAPHFKSGPGLGAGCIAPAYQLVCSGAAKVAAPVAAAPAAAGTPEGCGKSVSNIVKYEKNVKHAEKVAEEAQKAVTEARKVEEKVDELKAAEKEEAMDDAKEEAAKVEIATKKEEVKAKEVAEADEKKELEEDVKAAAKAKEPMAKLILGKDQAELKTEVEATKADVVIKKAEEKLSEQKEAVVKMQAETSEVNVEAKKQEVKGTIAVLKHVEKTVSPKELYDDKFANYKNQVEVAKQAQATPAAKAAKDPVVAIVEKLEEAKVTRAVELITEAENKMGEAKIVEKKAKEALTEVVEEAKTEQAVSKLTKDFGTVKKVEEILHKCKECPGMAPMLAVEPVPVAASPAAVVPLVKAPTPPAKPVR